jgi:hypothetical protein
MLSGSGKNNSSGLQIRLQFICQGFQLLHEIDAQGIVYGRPFESHNSYAIMLFKNQVFIFH